MVGARAHRNSPRTRADTRALTRENNYSADIVLWPAAGGIFSDMCVCVHECVCLFLRLCGINLIKCALARTARAIPFVSTMALNIIVVVIISKSTGTSSAHRGGGGMGGAL